MHDLIAGRSSDPFAILGPHEGTLTAFLPGAAGVQAISPEGQVLTQLEQVDPAGVFAGPLATGTSYLLRIDWGGSLQETEDPYSFGPLLGEVDLYLLAEGRHRRLAECLGAQMMTIDDVPGVRFAVWAPNARRVSVVGDFNTWDGRRHPMRLRHDAGVWEIFIPRLAAGMRYKFEILGPNWEPLPLKADPVAAAAEPAPGTASIITAPGLPNWTDQTWQDQACARNRPGAPMSVYEVHVLSWRQADGGPLGWTELAAQLVPYVRYMGFTHVELMPIMVHPFGGSWGYQPLGQFAPIASMGSAGDFAAFVNACHEAGVGVILDWVPAHFPNDAHGLERFDGTALYEHADPREGLHKDWNTLIYNLGRNEVRGFMIASALHWIEHFHIDGLRVDAVASMLYRDYSRNPGEWVPNIHGGRENLESVAFLRELSSTLLECCPDALLIAEESTAWPGVTTPVSNDAPMALGFSSKWNMGWMHDTLRYMEVDPLYRRYHHSDLTFGMIYAYSERFVLPLSHDEVVHGKKSLLEKMPGDIWQKFANLRAYFGFMWTHPGQKLLFMGGEFAQAREWNHDISLDWHLLDDPAHRGMQSLVRDLNHLYRQQPSLHAMDDNPEGFAWMIDDDVAQSVFAFLRSSPGAQPVLVVCNLTPVPRLGYQVGVPAAGLWREVFNSDALAYGGSGMGNAGQAMAYTTPRHGQPAAIELTLPPLGTIILMPELAAS